MNALTTVTLPPRRYKNGEVAVKETVLFSLADRAFLFCPESGTGIFLSAALADTLVDGNPCDDLLFKLVGRCMAQTEAARRLREVTADNKPTFFLIDMTRRCNLACDYCIRNTYPDPAAGTDITKEQLSEICRYIADHVRREKIGHFTIQPWGGEPTLELEKLVAIREFFNAQGMRPAIKFVCNGTLLTPERVRVLRENKMEYSISMDGDKPLHDAHRVTHAGVGSYDAVRRGIQCVREGADIAPSTVTTITADSIADAPRMLKHFGVECGIPFVKLNFVNISAADSMAIPEEGIAACVRGIVDTLIELHRDGHPVAEANVRQRTLNLLCRNNENICLSAGCQGGKRMVSFDFDGNIYPCELIGEERVKLGNIHDGKPLRQLLEAAQLQNPYFKDRREQRCHTCYWRYFCRGGCTSAAMVQEQQHTQVDITTCILNRIIYPLLIEKLLQDPKNAHILTGRGGAE